MRSGIFVVRNKITEVFCLVISESVDEALEDCRSKLVSEGDVVVELLEVVPRTKGGINSKESLKVLRNQWVQRLEQQDRRVSYN
ncbi:MAG: hypothetical protein ACRCTE_12415 [Cellulosilyticaceae bacterium]